MCSSLHFCFRCIRDCMFGNRQFVADCGIVDSPVKKPIQQLEHFHFTKYFDGPFDPDFLFDEFPHVLFGQNDRPESVPFVVRG